MVASPLGLVARDRLREFALGDAMGHPFGRADSRGHCWIPAPPLTWTLCFYVLLLASWIGSVSRDTEGDGQALHWRHGVSWAASLHGSVPKEKSLFGKGQFLYPERNLCERGPWIGRDSSVPRWFDLAIRCRENGR